MNTLLHPIAAADATPALDIAALLGPEQWQGLSAAIRHRFAAGHADVSYRGTMRLRHSAIGRCFAALAGLLGSPLAAFDGDEVPALVNVRQDGHGGVIWERHLGGSHDGRQIVRSTKRLGPDGQLDECTDGGLSMRLDVRVEDGALVFYSRRYFLLLGHCRLPVPALLTPGTCRVEHRDEGPGRFRFTLDMVHPLWGRTFHQTGVFQDPQEF
jgi:hypothetical protein